MLVSFPFFCVFVEVSLHKNAEKKNLANIQPSWLLMENACLSNQTDLKFDMMRYNQKPRIKSREAWVIITVFQAFFSDCISCVFNCADPLRIYF